MCSEPGQASEAGLFAEVPSALSYVLFLWRVPSQMFGWILNTRWAVIKISTIVIFLKIIFKLQLQS